MIEAVDLTKRYGPRTVVDGLSFTVRPGRVTGFLGPNGAGKSTTMRMILGLDLPSRGRVTVGGQPYAALRRPLHRIGGVLEVRALHGGRSAYHHLLCLAQSNGIGRRRVAEVLDLVGLGDAARRRAKGFSLGMSQRLGLAAALLGDPPVLVCDEPVNGLDPEGILWIRTLLRGLAAEGRTVLISSHLMSEMALTADHLVIIGRGRLLADEATRDFVARNSRGHLIVGSAEHDRLADVLRRAGAEVTTHGDDDRLEVTGLDRFAVGDLAARERLTIHELTAHGASLESAYMDLTRAHAEFAANDPTGDDALSKESA